MDDNRPNGGENGSLSCQLLQEDYDPTSKATMLWLKSTTQYKNYAKTRSHEKNVVVVCGVIKFCYSVRAKGAYKGLMLSRFYQQFTW